jgi:energy-coupling factor transporter transmembrane protein EcfT
MEDKYFSLELNKANRFTRIFQLVFGIICSVIAVIWLILNLSTLKSNGSLWITIIFLFGFAFYQINSGIGRADKFIEIGQTVIKLKKNSLFPPQELRAADIDKTEIFPLNIIFFMKSGKTVILRFGTTFTDIIDPVKEAIDNYCNRNNLKLEIRIEEF